MSENQKALSQQEQLDEWVKGHSFHRMPDDLCCPDFSCCRFVLQAPEEVRKAFVAGSSSNREKFLMGFVGTMMADLDQRKRVHIAGCDPEDVS